MERQQKAILTNGNSMNLYECPRCTCGLSDESKFCPNCGQRVIYPWDAEWKLMDYVDYESLEETIDKLDNTPAPELKWDVNDNMRLYNWLKELREYRKIGTLKSLLN